MASLSDGGYKNAELCNGMSLWGNQLFRESYSSHTMKSYSMTCIKHMEVHRKAGYPLMPFTMTK